MVKYLTLKEEERLLSSIKGRHSKRDKMIVLLAVNTGLRVSELCDLKISDIKNGKVKAECLIRKEITKGRRERSLPLNKKARKAIKEIIASNVAHHFKQDQESKLLISQKGQGMSRQQIQTMIKKAREKAGLDIKATPHSLRHSFATRVYEQTKDIRVVQKLLGHRSITTTQIYADVTREKLKEAVNLL